MKLGEILVNYCDEHDMKLAEMEKRTGLSRTYLYALRRGDFFGLIIRGDSMYPKIEDGDMVVVRVQENVEDGEIAIVRANGDDATCKVIKRDDKHIYLQSINPMYMPMVYDLSQIDTMPIEIVGKVFEIRRKLY